MVTGGFSTAGGECVYLVGAEGTNLVKIGRTRDLAKRLGALQRMGPAKLGVLWSIAGGADLETALHRRFADLRSHGEWFDFQGDDVLERVSEAVAEIRASARFNNRRGVGRISVRDVSFEGFAVGDVVRIVREGWAYSETGVIQYVNPAGEYPLHVQENDGRRHSHLAMCKVSEVTREDAVPAKPRAEACRGVGCMCANVV